MNNLFSPKNLEQLCRKYGLRPSKKYGQNFLIDENVIEKIIEAEEIKNTDTVIEVGPGFGTLTLALAERAGRVVSFEIEKKLESYWSELQKKNSNIEIIWGNVLKRFEGGNTGSYKVVANIPYQITS